MGKSRAVMGNFDHPDLPRKRRKPPPEQGFPFRADDRIRTGDPHLGKVMLYQLSHVRVGLSP